LQQGLGLNLFFGFGRPLQWGDACGQRLGLNLFVFWSSLPLHRGRRR
jgi:hypothetical protein